MISFYYILTACFVVSTNILAQKNKDIYKVKNGVDISKAIPFEERYQFEKFRDGNVYFLNGKVTKASLNYSLVHGEIQFLNPGKDTLLLTENDFIDKISVGGDIFYYIKGHGHIQQKADFDKIKLAEKQFLVVMGKERYAAYDQYSATSAIASYSGYTNGSSGAMQQLEGNDKVVLKKRSVYFWIDKNKRFSYANKANLLRIFPKYKRELNDFIKDSQVDFAKEDDLIKVIEYSSSLQ